VYGDRDRLHQVIANLLNNAMKFTKPGGTIVLRAELVDDEVQVSVSDTGIGVADTDQERIFEKFQQVGDTLTDKPRGTGLGLAICRDIVEHHQGRMWVDSTPGVGSTFSVALPSEAEPVARAA
jgi:signal transduction histidine kinase